MPVYSFDRLRMFVEAMNGQLPDIDLVSDSAKVFILFLHNDWMANLQTNLLRSFTIRIFGLETSGPVRQEM